MAYECNTAFAEDVQRQLSNITVEGWKTGIECDGIWPAWFCHDESSLQAADSVDQPKSHPLASSQGNSNALSPPTLAPLPAKQRDEELSFFDLPPELRLDIYAYITADHRPNNSRGGSSSSYCSYYGCPNDDFGIPTVEDCGNIGYLPVWCRYAAPRRQAAHALLNKISTTSTRLMDEFYPVWLGLHTFWVPEDLTPGAPRRKRGDFPALKRYLRDLGQDASKLRSVRVTTRNVAADDIPSAEMVERALEGFDWKMLHPNLRLEVAFWNGGPCRSVVCSGRVLCGIKDGKMMVHEHWVEELAK